jgi:hypothetical protein
VGRAEEVGGFAMSRKVVVPGAIGATMTLFILFLREGIVLCVLASPGNGASSPTPQTCANWYIPNSALLFWV